ncbi:phage terminase small subunit-related protein [Fibrobacter sp.]|uniref:phage terminase small subunit-related protein n=1 Tax=Fibrobacter sp. TaxID=35828 RepID=UPI0025C0EA11|nr:phage terminase small subunit-related protein [Fibrobacter sp.]MBR3070251.1 hypothetical protein [Fibrobacter sp.]
MSKAELKPRAKELYTIHQMSLADISRALNVSTRTLQTWKAEEHWDKARAAVSGGEKNFHAQLFELGEVMARKIKQDELDGVKVAPERYTALQRIIDTAEHARKYEAVAPKQNKSDLSPEEKQQAALAKMKEALGLC